NFGDSVSEVQEKTAFALVVAGASLVERIGGKRRRGQGKCRLTLERKVREWMTWLQQNVGKAGEPPKIEAINVPFNNINPETTDQTWHSIQLTIRTKSPVIVPARTVGNLVECHDYIPGRYLLPILQKEWGKKVDIFQAIAQGELLVTHATLSIDEKAGRPTPFCLAANKLGGGLDQGRGVYNLLQERAEPGIQLKKLQGNYVGQLTNGTLPTTKKVNRKIFTHNIIADAVQRPTSDTGGVFSYQAIPEGLTFSANLRVTQRWKKLLDQKIRSWQTLDRNFRLGQSKKDQYGSVKIFFSDGCHQIENAIQPLTGELLVWCLSDVLLRNERLSSSLDPQIFLVALAQSLEINPAQITLKQSFLRVSRSESWQVSWGLSRPSLVGIKSGSCFAFELDQSVNINPKKLAEITASGIGERRAEGYGQVSFNDPLLSSSLGALTAPDDSDNPYGGDLNIQSQLTNESMAYLHILERALWREKILAQAFIIAGNADRRQEILGIEIRGKESKPPMSQLGSFRSVIGRLQTIEVERNPVIAWVEALQAVDNRREKWPADSLANCCELVTESERIWDVLKFSDEYTDQITATSANIASLKQELGAEAVRTLVGEIIRAHKRDWEKVQQRGEAS
ncbi:MAG: hypothetical protein AAGG02_17095, partial [Cyanobacteria bacterium P01_H01_bin.15]